MYHFFFYHFKSIIQKLSGFFEATVPVFGVHDDDDEFVAPADGGGGKAAGGGSGVACLDACGALIGIKELVGVRDGEDFYWFLVTDLFVFCGNEGAEFFIFHGIAGKSGHVDGGGIMIFIRHAVGVGEVGVFHANRFCLVIHHGGEGRKVSGDIFCNGGGSAVVGDEHHLVLKVAQSEPFAACKGGGFHMGGISGNHYCLIGISLFNGKDGSHDFCHARRVFSFIPILFVKDFSCRPVHDDRCVCGESGGRCAGGKRGKEEEKGKKDIYIFQKIFHTYLNV